MATEGAAESDSQCAALVQSLNKVTACHHHLAVSLGGSADCARLREELRCTRERAHGVADATRVALTLLLRDKAVVGERRAELERLWVSFSCCLELLEGDMRRALEISGQFPVGAARVRTGMSGTTVAIASRALSAKDVRSAAAAAGGGGGPEDTQALEKDVQENWWRQAEGGPYTLAIRPSAALSVEQADLGADLKADGRRSKQQFRQTRVCVAESSVGPQRIVGRPLRVLRRRHLLLFSSRCSLSRIVVVVLPVTLLGTMLNEMENKVNVPRWSVVAAREPGAELHSTASGSSMAMLTEEGARGEPCCDPGRRLMAVFCGGALLLALVLAAAVVMFA
ncbi:regulator of G-protein signaling 9-binding protein [Lampetra fluviatilis]